MLKLKNKYEGYDYINDFSKMEDGNSIVHLAALNGRSDLLWYLLNNGYEKFLGTENNFGYTPLVHYVYSGIANMKDITVTTTNQPVLELFFKKGADILQRG